MKKAIKYSLLAGILLASSCSTVKIQGTKYSDGTINWDYQSKEGFENKIPVERVEGRHKTPTGTRLTTAAGYLLMPINLIKDGYNAIRGDTETEARKAPRKCLENGYCELDLKEDSIKSLED